MARDERDAEPGGTSPVPCAAIRGLCIDHALGQADAQDAERVQRHLAACAACRRELAAFERTVGLLRKADAVAPSPAFRARLDAALEAAADGAERAPPVRMRVAAPRGNAFWQRRWVRVAAACVPLAVGASLLWHRVGDRDAESIDWSGITFVRPEQRVVVDDSAQRPTELPLPPDAPPPDYRPFEDDPTVALPPKSGGSDPAPLGAPPGARTPEQVAGSVERVGARPEPDGAKSGVPRASEKATVARETPVRRALGWLAGNQRPDGSWTPGEGEPGIDAGVTALALLALVTDGHLGLSDPPPGGDALELAAVRASRWLFAQQDPRDGLFRGGHDDVTGRFCHALATLALVERHVRARAVVPGAAKLLAHERDLLERALTRCEVVLDLTFHDNQDRRSGAIAAWAALALATARQSHVDFHLKVTSEKLADRMKAQLRVDPSDVLRAASQTVLAMAARDARPIERNSEWVHAVGEVTRHLGRAEPSLRFLVASALAGDPGSTANGTWSAFRAALVEQLLPKQAPSGYFDSGVAWADLGGGVAYETALSALALEVEQRRR